MSCKKVLEKYLYTMFILFLLQLSHENGADYCRTPKQCYNSVGHVSLPGVARICYGRPRGGATARVVSELGQVQPRRGGYVSRAGGWAGTNGHTLSHLPRVVSR